MNDNDELMHYGVLGTNVVAGLATVGKKHLKDMMIDHVS